MTKALPSRSSSITDRNYSEVVDANGREEVPDPREQIIGSATSLFAALGYDATPIEMIADSSGVDLPTLTTLVGDKQTIYRSVMDRVQSARRAMFDMVITDFTPDRAGMHQLTDRALDHAVAHPELHALWMHRWHSDAADIPELERVYLQPDLDRFRALVQGMTPAETNVDLALLTLTWAISGFCIGGVLNSEGVREGPENPVLLEQFRQHLYRLADLMFGLD